MKGSISNMNPGSTVSAKLKYDQSDLHIFWLVVNGATPNAQQTIYRLYFGAFGTQCKRRII